MFSACSRRVEVKVGQWKEKAELTVLEKGKRKKKDREDGGQKKMEEEDDPEPLGLKEPQEAS